MADDGKPDAGAKRDGQGKRASTKPAKVRAPSIDDAYPRHGPFKEISVSRERLAHLLALEHGETVSRLAKEELVKTVAPGVYSQDASVRKYVIHLRALAAQHSGGSTGISIMDENALTKRANRESAEMRRDEAAERLFDEKTIDEAWAQVVKTLRNLVQTAPKIIAAEMPNISKKDMAQIAAIHHRLLKDASIGNLLDNPPDISGQSKGTVIESETD